MDRMNEFGQFFKRMRQKKGYTLRSFCLKHGLDPGNISKMERGLIPPPSAREKLEQYASFLGLKAGSNEWYDFFDLAAANTGRIPDDLMGDSQLVKKLPLVFRTLRGQKVEDNQLTDLAELIRRS